MADSLLELDLQDALRRLNDFSLNDQGFMRSIDVATDKVVGWHPETDEDENDSRYELWWAVRHNVFVKVACQWIAEQFHPSTYAPGDVDELPGSSFPRTLPPKDISMSVRGVHLSDEELQDKADGAKEDWTNGI